jgi:hypothetical protein
VGGGQQKTTSNNSQTYSLDPATQRYVDNLRSRASFGMNDLANANLNVRPNQALYGAGAGIDSIQGGGALPFLQAPTAAGTTANARELFNPFISGVIDPTRAEFDFLRGRAGTDARSMATTQGAFGGSRAAAYEGARTGEIDRAQASEIARLFSGGFDNAMQGAFRLGDQGIAAGSANLSASVANNGQMLQGDIAKAGMGLQRAGMLQDIDQYNASLPFLRNAAIMNTGQAGMGPVQFNTRGSSSSVTKMQQDPFAQLLGAGLTLGSFFLPGAGAGAGAGPQISGGMLPGGSPWMGQI